MEDSKVHSDDCGVCGTVSAGTLRAEDLLPRLARALGALLEARSTERESARSARERKLAEVDVAEIEQRFEVSGYFESEDAAEDLDWLVDRLNDYAPEGHWFGAHPSDGADFGFWPSELLE